MGEKRLFSSIDSDKLNGINNFKEKRFSEAESKFVEALKNNKNDPESLIYKNNAQINALMQNNSEIKPILISTSVPKGGNKAVALEILRGVAHAHNDIMKDFESKCIDEKKLYKVGCDGGIKGRPLQIMIIDDSNNPDIAVKIAKYLVKKQKEVYALVGHNASEVSSKAAIEYQKGKLVMVTPNSFALDFEKLDKKDGERAKGNYIFAVTYSHEILIKKVIDEMKHQLPTGEIPRVLLCYDANAFDQNVIVGSFENFAKNNKGEIELIGVKEKSNTLNIMTNAKDISCDFSKADLNLADVLENAKNKDGINVIFVASHVNRIGDSIAVLKNIKRDSSLANIKIFSSPTLYTNQTLELGGKNVANLTMAVSWFPEKILKVGEVQFEGEAIELWTEDSIKICHEEDDFTKETCINHLDILDEIGITWRTAMAYDATHILIEGFRGSGEISRQSLSKSLSEPEFSFEGVTGLVKFFSSCSTEEINSKDVECFPGKRMVTGRNPDPAIIIKVNEVTERITHYRFNSDK
ncbi:ABC transporter substrate-binding protein [Nitrosomonas sp.]|uniref:ABC transporter substrate-binding protein n=1 Tax=Nitrosomonas sp. TaxID=42353 RepID=UPI0025CEE5C1|nr:ABC transporter substrate-binding protein [Nitrosomonas sp.]